MPPLRIGVNALYLLPGGVGGTEIYLRGLVAALARIDPENRYYLFTNRESAGTFDPPGPNFILRPQAVRAASRPFRIAWEQTVLPLEAARLGLDVLLNPGFTAPLWCGCPQVTVMHDLQHKRHPEFFRWFDLPFWRLLLYWAAHLSGRIIAPSRATARDLMEIYRLPAGRIRVIPLGVEAELFGIASRRRPEPFFLTVSTLHPHKNLDRLLRAFAAFRRKRPEFRLVLAGMHGFFTGELERLRAELGLETSVEMPGWMPRHALYELYARAWAFLYPSRFEGFGLPVLEAMAAGVPTACSNIAPLMEIGSGAVLPFDPLSTEAIGQSMLRLADDEPLRENLGREGPLRAAPYTWEACARATLQVLREAANPGSRKPGDRRDVSGARVTPTAGFCRRV